MNYLFTLDQFEDAFRKFQSLNEINLPHPPSNFLDAAIYYAAYFEFIKIFLSSNIALFSDDEAEENFLVLSKVALLLFQLPIQNQLVEIWQKYRILAETRATIRHSFAPLHESIDAMERLRSHFDLLRHVKVVARAHDFACGATLRNQLSVDYNPFYQKLAFMSKLLSQEGQGIFNVNLEDEPEKTRALKRIMRSFAYAPVSVLTRKRCFPRFESMVLNNLDKFPLGPSFDLCSVIYSFAEAKA